MSAQKEFESAAHYLAQAEEMIQALDLNSAGNALQFALCETYAIFRITKDESALMRAQLMRARINSAIIHLGAIKKIDGKKVSPHVIS